MPSQAQPGLPLTCALYLSYDFAPIFHSIHTYRTTVCDYRLPYHARSVLGSEVGLAPLSLPSAAIRPSAEFDVVQTETLWVFITQLPISTTTTALDEVCVGCIARQQHGSKWLAGGPQTHKRLHAECRRPFPRAISRYLSFNTFGQHHHPTTNNALRTNKQAMTTQPPSF